jgi:hypothetical protein
MKRLLLPIAIAALIAGCGSSGSSAAASSRTKTTHHKPARRAKKVVHHRKITHHKRVVHHKRSVVVTTSAVTTTAATTTYTPPPTSTSTYTPPPTATHTTSVVPTTTHQTTTHHRTHTSTTTSQGYCLSVTARIDTPGGAVPVAQVRPGMSVLSTDLSGRSITVKVLRVHHTAVPASHMMVSLRLADGRRLLVSLGHPLPNGEPVSSLVAGEQFEGTSVVSAARVRYGRPYTYDLLPAGPTHTYFADGILMGSTLAPRVATLTHPF